VTRKSHTGEVALGVGGTEGGGVKWEERAHETTGESRIQKKRPHRKNRRGVGTKKGYQNNSCTVLSRKRTVKDFPGGESGSQPGTRVSKTKMNWIVGQNSRNSQPPGQGGGGNRTKEKNGGTGRGVKMSGSKGGHKKVEKLKKRG